MPLRCLIFTSLDEVADPIRQVLAELGLEGEFCPSAVDAVERVTTQQFQIVITDWDNQPEAGFLLKTARDQKPAQRPLTVAVVSSESKLPEALQAGANSVLVKPVGLEQARDTISTACQLLRSRQQSAAPAANKPPVLATPAADVAPALAEQPEKVFRAGEFLQTPASTPGAQFDTEKTDAQKSLEEAAAAVDAIADLEPTAAGLQDSSTEPQPENKPHEPLTGWAALQARLNKPATSSPELPGKTDLLSYGETPSQSAAAPALDQSGEWSHTVPPKPAAEEIEPVPGIALEDAPGPPPSKRGQFIFLVASAAVIAILFAVPRTRLILRGLTQKGVHAARNWLNPPPVALPQTPTQHDSFALAGDEYKLPTPENIPDATTDPAQIRVVPVVDPTAKPDKSPDANNPVAASPVLGNDPTSPPPATPDGSVPAPSPQAPSEPPASTPVDVKPSAASATDVPASTTVPVVVPTAPPVQSAPLIVHAATPQQHPLAPRPVSVATVAAIPSSLKTQLASSTPEASGTRPPETAMSSIEPVSLAEAALRDLLAQAPADPQYPATARGQTGTVVLQVLISRDGVVEEAKFLQGSLLFARPAIDAVRQWRFKPYQMNGRAVSVQSNVTLNFKPPA
ncbi:MAG TPA: TonB family protein [Candidatus Binatia bacterium]|nr:TonB family protein [Candidatus Binatia bacterium]